jgi:hypothetical protein
VGLEPVVPGLSRTSQGLLCQLPPLRLRKALCGVVEAQLDQGLGDTGEVPGFPRESQRGDRRGSRLLPQAVGVVDGSFLRQQRNLRAASSRAVFDGSDFTSRPNGSGKPLQALAGRAPYLPELARGPRQAQSLVWVAVPDTPVERRSQVVHIRIEPLQPLRLPAGEQLGLARSMRSR